MTSWKLDDGSVIQLVTPAELKDLPNGTVLLDIFGEKVTLGVDVIDDDTRGGYLAYGLPDLRAAVNNIRNKTIKN